MKRQTKRIFYWAAFGRLPIQGVGCAGPVALGCCATLWAAMGLCQQRQPAALTEYIGRGAFPAGIRIQVQRMGDRIRVAGKERVVLDGTFTDTSGARPGRIIYQLPDNFRLETSGPGGGVLIFDGQTGRSSRGVLDANDQGVLEALLADFPDSVFHDLRLGAALRLLGIRFRPKLSVAPSYTGPLYDIYDFAVKVRTRPDKLQRAKRLYFDSKTALLLSVRYSDLTRTGSPRVETRYSDWRDFAGSPLPLRIDRVENGKVIVSFQASSAQVLARGDSSIFRQPN